MTTRRAVLGGGLAGAAALALGLGACSADEAIAPTTTDGATGGARGGAPDPTSTTTTPASAPSPSSRAVPATTVPEGSAAPTVSRGRTKLVVLGSQGGQQITQLTGAGVRAGSSLLIDVDGELLVIDCGCGSVHRLAEAGYDADAVRHVLVTHAHADHVAELGALASFAWSSGRNGRDPDRRLDIFGPTGIADCEAGTKRSFRRSIADQEGPLAQLPTFDVFATWHELDPPDEVTPVFETDRFSVRTMRVQHGSMPSVGYRIETPDLVIAVSGDRGARGDDFVALAEGADVLVHEVIHRTLVETTLERQGAAPSFVDHLVEDHTDAPDVGRLATAAGVGALVLHHLIPGSPAVTDAAWTELVRPHYDGPIIVAKDLLVV